MPIFSRDPENITLYSLDDVLGDVRGLVSKLGTQAAAAKSLGVSSAYLSDILTGNRAVSEAFAAKLGYRPVRWFERAEGK